MNDWIAAVLAALPSLGLKTIQELGGEGRDSTSALVASQSWGIGKGYKPSDRAALRGHWINVGWS